MTINSLAYLLSSFRAGYFSWLTNWLDVVIIVSGAATQYHCVVYPLLLGIFIFYINSLKSIQLMITWIKLKEACTYNYFFYINTDTCSSNMCHNLGVNVDLGGSDRSITKFIQIWVRTQRTQFEFLSVKSKWEFYFESFLPSMWAIWVIFCVGSVIWWCIRW